jgi:hypothetical protein
MKHIPVLALTVLTAAASAQTAPAAAPAAKQSFSYDRVVLNYVSVSGGDADKGVSVFAQATLGKGLYLSGTATNLENTTQDNSSTTASLGYAYSLPKTLGIASDLNLEIGHDTYSLGLRALLGGGLELGLAYSKSDANAIAGTEDFFTGEPDYSNNTFTVSAIYSLGQFVKGLTLNASYADETNGGDFITTFGIGYNF